MRPRKVTLQDPSLTHQVRFLGHHNTRVVTVSCNCLASGHTGGGYDPMGPGPNLAAARALYDDPANHRKPFDPDVDRARW